MRMVIFFLLFFCSSTHAYFGSCGDQKTAEEIFALDDVAIFRGKVVKAWIDQRKDTWYIAANFELYELYKGNIEKDAVVRSQSPEHFGGPKLHVASTYLFVVDKEGVVDRCLTGKYTHAAKIFEQLSELKYAELRKLRPDS
ncbi:hypothetical protein [Microbulbifer hydrolyticus]|uniref:Uncharacterized protein n=1 Tax=Microbulbifer hydrolyticus TaxID=48074 RepID=A0A6P1TCE6_9GAMM|nr:hypothetical protein [Microbulbifer hydrolyticus]MBB5213327.1 hypothetical protein [Microbulbifer hydrolyticus]QHQ40464.1 hypothetical protein GTQ55_16765 [Microbulbifer hydrolyticus]